LSRVRLVVPEPAPEAASGVSAVEEVGISHLDGSSKSHTQARRTDRSGSRPEPVIRPILVNLLRFPPAPRTPEPAGGNSHGGDVKPVLGRPVRRYALRTP